MPIKSKAQRRKFAQLLLEGKISEEVYEEWNRGAGKKVLPERLHPKKAEQPKRRTRTTVRKKAAKRAAASKKPVTKKSSQKKSTAKKAVRKIAVRRKSA